MKLRKSLITYVLSLALVVMTISIAQAGYWKMQGEPIFEYGPNNSKAREWVGQVGTKIQLLDFDAKHFTIKESNNIAGGSQTLTYRAEFVPPSIVMPNEIVAIRTTVTAINVKSNNDIFLQMDLPGCVWQGIGSPVIVVSGQTIDAKAVGASLTRSNTSVRAQAPPASQKDVSRGTLQCAIVPTAWGTVAVNIPYVWVDQVPPTTTVTSHKPGSSGMPPSDILVYSNFNPEGVQSGPTRALRLNFKDPYRITSIKNYHYFNGGKRAGTIALQHEDGTIYGPWQAEGADLGGNVPNAYWIARPNNDVKPGIYTVIDSDPSTWSCNPRSKGSGFVEIRGVKLVAQEAPQYKPQVRQEKSTASSSGRENARDGRFIAYKNGTVLDTKTKLMWAAKDNGSAINWANAESYCKNYRGGGYSDWRMPTQDELAGLYDVGKSRPAGCDPSHLIHVSTELIDITCFALWASETRGSEAVTFLFISGLRHWGPKENVGSRIALPVRSAR